MKESYANRVRSISGVVDTNTLISHAGYGRRLSHSMLYGYDWATTINVHYPWRSVLGAYNAARYLYYSPYGCARRYYYSYSIYGNNYYSISKGSRGIWGCSEQSERWLT